VNQTLAGQIRALRHALQLRVGERIAADAPVMAWLIRHAGWLITRFSMGTSGRTPYEQLRGRGYRGELVEIGERVYAKKPGDQPNKLDSRWEAGIWVGKTETSEEHLVSTQHSGVLRMRVIRRRIPAERWNLVELKALRGAPWDLKPKLGAEPGQGVYESERKQVPEPNQSPAVQLDPDTGPATRGTYITKALLTKFGVAAGCPKCATGKGAHTAECKSRIEAAVEAEASTTAAQPAQPMEIERASRPGVPSAAAAAAEEAPRHSSSASAAAAATEEAPPAVVRSRPDDDDDADWRELARRMKPRREQLTTPTPAQMTVDEEHEAGQEPKRAKTIGGLAVNVLDAWEAEQFIDDESSFLNDTADPLPILHDDGSIHWQGPAASSHHEGETAKVKREITYDVGGAGQPASGGSVPAPGPAHEASLPVKIEPEIDMVGWGKPTDQRTGKRLPREAA